jgi:DNA-binding GntR family transcriptional regulator
LLETEVVEHASKTINSAHINQLVSILQQQGLAVSRNDHDEFMELDEKFHHALCQSVTCHGLGK